MTGYARLLLSHQRSLTTLEDKQSQLDIHGATHSPILNCSMGRDQREESNHKRVKSLKDIENELYENDELLLHGHKVGTKQCLSTIPSESIQLDLEPTASHSTTSAFHLPPRRLSGSRIRRGFVVRGVHVPHSRVSWGKDHGTHIKFSWSLLRMLPYWLCFLAQSKSLDIIFTTWRLPPVSYKGRRREFTNFRVRVETTTLQVIKVKTLWRCPLLLRLEWYLIYTAWSAP